jgi:hypothetical protein
MNNLELDEIVNSLYSNLNEEIVKKNFTHLNDVIELKLINKLTSKLINKLTNNVTNNVTNNLRIELEQTRLIDYIAEENYTKILNYDTKYLITNKNYNLFDVDINFIKQAYNLNNLTDKDIINFVKENHYTSYVFHPKQLYNLFNNKIELLFDKSTNYIFVKYEKIYYKLREFLKHIESYSYDTIKNICIREIENHNFTENRLLLLFYIGSEQNTNIFIEKIKMYSKIENFTLAFCINYRLLDNIIPLIKKEISTNYIIYSSNELGSDITPTLLMYDDIIHTKKYNFDYIMKIHTKTDAKFLNKAIDYLFEFDLNTLLSINKNNNSSSIGFTYLKNTDDVFNKILVSKYSDFFINKNFVPGTILLTNNDTINKVLQFFKNNYKIIFFQNMYDNNSLNKDNSYVHFMERLFGYI